MKTGLLVDGGDWYHLDNSGLMRIGWINSEGSWYFLNDSEVIKNKQALVSDIQWDHLDKDEAPGTYR
ncbi:hypothetical protein V7152_21240 [Neobacillus drentensis]|uniref:hypothetical protein n=1 Tax=Neobacillus drentensis TaxID=220684 RepID=UPI002FFF5446